MSLPIFDVPRDWESHLRPLLEADGYTLERLRDIEIEEDEPEQVWVISASGKAVMDFATVGIGGNVRVIYGPLVEEKSPRDIYIKLKEDLLKIGGLRVKGLTESAILRHETSRPPSP